MIKLLNVFAAGIPVLTFLFMSKCPAWGQTSQGVIKAGDRVQVQITCRELSGDLILTTLSDVAGDTGRKKSVIYKAPKKFEPLRVVAGKSEMYAGKDRLKSFNRMLTAKLSEALVGMKVGENVILTFHAPVPKELPEEERYITLTTNRKVDKKVSGPKSAFIEKGKPGPLLGQEIIEANGVIRKITAVNEDTVELAITGKDGDTVDTPWGKGIMHDEGQEWRLEIIPRIGRLVRIGPYVGRINSVQKDRYTVDFGCPFGNESIECDISIVAIIDGGAIL